MSFENTHRLSIEDELTLCSLIRSPYRNVFTEWSVADAPGETVAIIVVLESGEKQSFKINVSLDPRYGTWLDFCPNARIHSFRASSDVLISADSVLRCEL